MKISHTSGFGLIPMSGIPSASKYSRLKLFFKNLDFCFIYSALKFLLSNTRQYDLPLYPKSPIVCFISLILAVIVLLFLYPVKWLLLGMGYLHLFFFKCTPRPPLLSHIYHLEQALKRPTIVINPHLKPRLPKPLKKSFSKQKEHSFKLSYFRLLKTLNSLHALTNSWRKILINLCKYRSSPNGQILTLIMEQFNKALQNRNLSFEERQAAAFYIALYKGSSPLTIGLATYFKLLELYKQEDSIEDLLLFWVLEFKECLLFDLATNYSLKDEDIWQFKKEFNDSLGFNFHIFKNLKPMSESEHFRILYQKFLTAYTFSISKLSAHIELCIYNSSSRIKRLVTQYVFSQLGSLDFTPHERVLIMNTLFYSNAPTKELNQLGVKFLLEGIHILSPYPNTKKVYKYLLLSPKLSE